MTSIGIRYEPNTSAFLSGVNQTAITLAEVFSKLGHSIQFVHTSDTQCTESYTFPIISMYQIQSIDLLIDIDGQLSHTLYQKAKKTVIFLRTFLQFAELDSVVYLETPYNQRNMKGVHEVWCWDILNPKETIPAIQTIFPCPIRTVPFIWSSTVVTKESEHHIATFCEGSWTVHVAEKNKNNTSSCILPLVAIRELERKPVIDANYLVHHTDHIKENRFLKENVLNNIEMDTLPITFADHSSYLTWVQEPNTILFSHSRFVSLQIRLLNALWLGLPVIHNSPVLKDLHPLLSNVFYTGSSVSGISTAFSWIQTHSAEWREGLSSIRQAIMNAFVYKENQWASILTGVQESYSVIPSVPSVPSVKPVIPTILTIAFSDMWPGFNYDSNFIMDTLRRHSKKEIRGIPYSKEESSQLLIFGPYGQTWKDIPLPKIFFSAENWNTPSDPSIQLYLTSSREENETHLRIPTWMTFIDWYSESKELPTSEDNPIRIPLHFATTSHPVPFSIRNGFCGFVVSNPICNMRNETFNMINQYKKVDSGGGLYNNIGGQLSLKYPGGGCGDISKHRFFAEKKFTISFENSQAPGYITEKVLHSKMAGCVPLYWGDKDTDSDFAPNSFINLSNTSDPQLVLQVIKKLEANPEMCAKIAATPILNQEKVLKAHGILYSMAEKILECVGISSSIKGIEKTFVINLDTRPDRWNKLLEAEPYLEPLVERISGVNGKTLEMNKDIYQLFEKNQFQWKKSVIGCNLSHISVWKKIAESSVDGYYLVLEDDVRFQKGWLSEWKKCARRIPADADLLYLGGVLPPNKKGLPLATEHVNECWSCVKPNTLFSPVPMPVFHFCAYSYILTRAGARKLMSYLFDSENKSFTVSDHLLGHPSVGLKKYFTNPLLSYCFQEEDPVYLASAFNDLHREDTFDSDIWNNKECFTEVELAPFKRTVYYISNDAQPFGLYEKSWLEDILQVRLDFKQLPHKKTDFPTNTWFLVQRPYLKIFNELFRSIETPFQVLHVSDEFCTDDISFYHLPNCKKVIRNYMRDDVANLPEVYTIPLGYHYRSMDKQKTWDERELLWSFHGTNWFDRGTQLEPLKAFEPHSCHLQPSWNHVTATKEKPYVSLLGNTKFCPILKGQNVETFRLYEALEAGALPITTITDPTYLKWIDKHLELSSLYPWTDPVAALQTTITEKIRQTISEKWAIWKGFYRELFSESI